MKVNRSNLIGFVIIILGLLMWYSNTDLFQRLEALSNTEPTMWTKIMNVVLPLGYSTLTAISIREIKQYKMVAGFAAFDSLAVFLHFQNGINPQLLNWIGAIYYAALMFFLVSMIWIMTKDQRDDNKGNEQEQESIQEPESDKEPPKEESSPTLAIAEPAKQIEPHTEPAIEISYMTGVAKIRGFRNGFSSEEEKNAKIQSFVQSLPDNDVKEQLADMVHRNYRINIDK